METKVFKTTSCNFKFDIDSARRERLELRRSLREEVQKREKLESEKKDLEKKTKGSSNDSQSKIKKVVDKTQKVKSLKDKVKVLEDQVREGTKKYASFRFQIVFYKPFLTSSYKNRLIGL